MIEAVSPEPLLRYSGTQGQQGALLQFVVGLQAVRPQTDVVRLSRDGKPPRGTRCHPGGLVPATAHALRRGGLGLAQVVPCLGDYQGSSHPAQTDSKPPSGYRLEATCPAVSLSRAETWRGRALEVLS